MKLSVVIVNYNVKYFLEQCLNSVLKAARTLTAEVIVVDNNSVDGSCEMIRSKFPQIVLIENKENTGFSKANNQAIKISKGDYVLLLNPDTLVEEDTFIKCIQFMDAHADAGGLGVYMIDGKGNFLPESKRGLPSPSVAFYKVFGLSALFPKSKVFGRYHLGYLDKNKTHEVDVLSGAFMMMRKSVLDKTGLLDETFFMYGEDIDLSYRITQAGFKNYYFPETKIIHYKGESTKKSSINYVFVFYKAMIIFAAKHYSKQNARLFSFLINAAVYLRAFIAIVNRIAKKIIVPLIDSVAIYSGLRLIQWYWETNIKAFHYPPFFDYAIVPGYLIIWIAATWLSGGYDRPLRISKALRGIITGSVLILLVYSMLPETMRFSRAMILLGTAWACFITPFIRWMMHAAGVKIYSLASNEKKRVVIVGSETESKRVLGLMQLSDVSLNFIGYVNTESENSRHDDFDLGSIERLSEIVDVFKIDEVIFCAQNVSSQMIIQSMLSIVRPDIEFKIAPQESLFVIGSNSINSQGNLYFVDLNAINNPVNKRNKRLFDILVSLISLLALPVMLLKVKNAFQFLKNIFKVLFGKISWVSLANSGSYDNSKYKKGVLTPLDATKHSGYDNQTIDRLNMLYAKEYNIYNDLDIILKNIGNLGRKP